MLLLSLDLRPFCGVGDACRVDSMSQSKYQRYAASNPNKTSGGCPDTARSCPNSQIPNKAGRFHGASNNSNSTQSSWTTLASNVIPTGAAMHCATTPCNVEGERCVYAQLPYTVDASGSFLYCCAAAKSPEYRLAASIALVAVLIECVFLADEYNLLEASKEVSPKASEKSRPSMHATGNDSSLRCNRPDDAFMCLMHSLGMPQGGGRGVMLGTVPEALGEGEGLDAFLQVRQPLLWTGCLQLQLCDCGAGACAELWCEFMV